MCDRASEPRAGGLAEAPRGPITGAAGESTTTMRRAGGGHTPAPLRPGVPREGVMALFGPEEEPHGRG
jgi:hypothetical protein